MKIFSIGTGKNIDLLVPLFSAIKHVKPEVKVHVLHPQVMDSDMFLYTELRTKAKIYKSRWAFLMALFSSPNSALLHSMLRPSELIKGLHTMNKTIGGKTFAHAETQRFSKSKMFLGKSYTNIPCDYFLAHGPNEERWLRHYKVHDKAIYIGYPRLYKDWQNLIRASATAFTPGDPYAVVVLPSTIEGLFGDWDLVNWLTEVLFSIRKFYPELPVFIKRHPHPSQRKKDLEDRFRSLYENIYFNNIHYEFLFARAEFIVLQYTGIAIDAFASVKPTITYLFPSSKWRRVHKDISQFIFPGCMWAKSPRELTACIEKVKDHRPVDIKTVIDHKEQITNFTELI